MKFFIVGLHASGKQEIMDSLRDAGLPTGRLFTNGDLSDGRYEFLSDQDVRTIFENNSYIFIKETGNHNNVFEGMSFHEFDSKKVFALTPDQFLAIPHKALNDEICIIWLDGTTAQRRSRYLEERRNYTWSEEEERETLCLTDFVQSVYSFPHSRVMYFFNEVPARVAAIIEAMIRHEDLIDTFTNNYKE